MSDEATPKKKMPMFTITAAGIVAILGNLSALITMFDPNAAEVAVAAESTTTALYTNQTAMNERLVRLETVLKVYAELGLLGAVDKAPAEVAPVLLAPRRAARRSGGVSIARPEAAEVEVVCGPSELKVKGKCIRLPEVLANTQQDYVPEELSKAIKEQQQQAERSGEQQQQQLAPMPSILDRVGVKR